MGRRRRRLAAEAARVAALEQLDRDRAALLRFVSHDLRTPLATIRAVATDLQAGTVYEDATRDELLGLVGGEAERLDRIVVTKPFSLPELLARVRVALRHRAYLSSVLDNHAIEVGGLTIDVDAHVARFGGQELDLTPKEFALLTLLARSAGKVLTHNTVLEQVWGPAQSRDTLRTHVQQLRRKLGDGAGHPRLLTEPGIGYRLVRPDD